MHLVSSILALGAILSTALAEAAVPEIIPGTEPYCRPFPLKPFISRPHISSIPLFCTALPQCLLTLPEIVFFCNDILAPPSRRTQTVTEVSTDYTFTTIFTDTTITTFRCSTTVDGFTGLMPRETGAMRPRPKTQAARSDIPVIWFDGLDLGDITKVCKCVTPAPAAGTVTTTTTTTTTSVITDTEYTAVFTTCMTTCLANGQPCAVAPAPNSCCGGCSQSVASTTGTCVLG